MGVQRQLGGLGKKTKGHKYWGKTQQHEEPSADNTDNLTENELTPSRDKWEQVSRKGRVEGWRHTADWVEKTHPLFPNR